MDTIFAVSSGAAPAAIAIVRISGPDAIAAGTALAGVLPAAHEARLRALRDPASRALLDRALVIVFPGPHTATGEDIVELHLHGGRAVIAAVCRALAGMAGLRGAEPGEFTRRALMNGRLDLAQAEGLGDLLMAETETQRRRALAAAEGAVSRSVAAWHAEITRISALIESTLDFADEADVDEDAIVGIDEAIAKLAAAIGAILAAPSTSRVRDGIRTVLAGPPNSGKSTLFNALAERDAAIVSPIAGTTRDRIEAPIINRGTAFLLIDTAGLVAESNDPIELIGVARAEAAIDGADILLWLGDQPAPRGDALWLWPRADGDRIVGPAGRLPVSIKERRGMSALCEALHERAAALLPPEDQLALNDRQRALCQACVTALEEASHARDPLIKAEALRIARRALDRITGIDGTEAMLDSLFARFCIGK